MALLKKEILIDVFMNRASRSKIVIYIVILVLLLFLFRPVDYDKLIYHDLGAGYIYAPWNETSPLRKEKFSFKELSVKEKSLISGRDKLCTKLDGLYYKTHQDLYISKARYNKDYIVLKSFLRENCEIYYWVIVKKSDMLFGPLDSAEVKKISLNNDELKFLLDDF